MFMANAHQKNPEAGEFVVYLMPTKKASASLAGRLKVTEANKLSTILNVSLMDEDPIRAEDILNQVLKVYQAANLLCSSIAAA